MEGSVVDAKEKKEARLGWIFGGVLLGVLTVGVLGFLAGTHFEARLAQWATQEPSRSLEEQAQFDLEKITSRCSNLTYVALSIMETAGDPRGDDWSIMRDGGNALAAFAINTRLAWNDTLRERLVEHFLGQGGLNLNQFNIHCGGALAGHIAAHEGLAERFVLHETTVLAKYDRYWLHAMNERGKVLRQCMTAEDFAANGCAVVFGQRVPNAVAHNELMVTELMLEVYARGGRAGLREFQALYMRILKTIERLPNAEMEPLSRLGPPPPIVVTPPPVANRQQ